MLYNVLLVEDDRRTADSLAAQIGVLGHTVGVALGPRQAIQQLNQVIPDVIFLDINMPGVDGLEVLRFLRRDPTTSKVPVVIVTANDSPDMMQAARRAGANYYIVKPTTLEDIERALERVLGKSPPYTPPPAQPASSAGRDGGA